METYKIIGIVLAFLLVAGCVYGFIETCKEKFNYNFFTKVSLSAMTAATGAAFIGKYLQESTMKNSAAHTTGLVLLSLSALIVVAMMLRNFQQTNFWYGLFGSVLQLTVLGAAGVVVISILSIYAGFQFLSVVCESSPSTVIDNSNDDYLDSDQCKTSANYDESSYFAWK